MGPVMRNGLEEEGKHDLDEWRSNSELPDGLFLLLFQYCELSHRASVVNSKAKTLSEPCGIRTSIYKRSVKLCAVLLSDLE